MGENHLDGYLKYQRDEIGKRSAEERVQDFNQIWKPHWDEKHVTEQGERCMDCGVPTCMAGCPIGNFIPEWNDLVYRDDWKKALDMLHATNNFPEFTGYTCPAPCENSCVLALNDNPVTIKSIERAIVDRGWEEGWITPTPPRSRTGYQVAIIGSGPAGLAAAQQLNRNGHYVTVFERDERPGGLMMLGIPDFKFAKSMVERRIDQLSAEGVKFRVNTEVGKDVNASEIFEIYDVTCISIGAQKHRELNLPGSDLDGIHTAMEYLVQENRHQAGKEINAGERISAKNKNVVVLGGGDTGADCVATAIRQGAEQVVQISINPQKPLERKSGNPWPEQPLIYKKTYAIEEGGAEEFSLDTVKFVDTDDDGLVNFLIGDKVQWTYEGKKRVGKKVLKTNLRIPADLVLVAIGFAGAQASPFDGTDLQFENGTLKTNNQMMTNRDGVFAAGDARMGQSLVVWAIGEGRDVARNIDKYIMGHTQLPASIKTPNPVFYKIGSK